MVSGGWVVELVVVVGGVVVVLVEVVALVGATTGVDGEVDGLGGTVVSNSDSEVLRTSAPSVAGPDSDRWLVVSPQPTNTRTVAASPSRHFTLRQATPAERTRPARCATSSGTRPIALPQDGGRLSRSVDGLGGQELSGRGPAR